MRLFIALNLPADIKAHLQQTQDILKKCAVEAKWVETKNLHITLKFLGEIKEESKTEKIKEIIAAGGRRFNSISVSLTNFGFFPNENRPRVFFIATDKEDSLKNIADFLEDKLEPLGFAKENRFKSHITLARLKSPKNIDCLKKEMELHRLKPIVSHVTRSLWSGIPTTLFRPYRVGIENISINRAFPIESLSLFKSTLTQSGVVYEEILKTTLRK